MGGMAGQLFPVLVGERPDDVSAAVCGDGPEVGSAGPECGGRRYLARKSGAGFLVKLKVRPVASQCGQHGPVGQVGPRAHVTRRDAQCR
jgi:hypothetical protein